MTVLQYISKHDLYSRKMIILLKGLNILRSMSDSAEEKLNTTRLHTSQSVSSLVRQVFDSIHHCIFCAKTIQVPLDPWISAVLGQSLKHRH